LFRPRKVKRLYGFNSGKKSADARNHMLKSCQDKKEFDELMKLDSKRSERPKRGRAQKKPSLASESVASDADSDDVSLSATLQQFATLDAQDILDQAALVSI
jgi:hypothetical protein